MEIEIIKTGKEFTLKSDTSASGVAEWIEKANVSNYRIAVFQNPDGSLVTGKLNKSEQAALERAIKNLNTPSKPKSTGSRRLELLATAEREGLPHGKAWVCTGYHVDANGAHPAWEGELICYVYNNQ